MDWKWALDIKFQMQKQRIQSARWFLMGASTSLQKWFEAWRMWFRRLSQTSSEWFYLELHVCPGVSQHHQHQQSPTGWQELRLCPQGPADATGHQKGWVDAGRDCPSLGNGTFSKTESESWSLGDTLVVSLKEDEELQSESREKFRKR